MIRSGVFLMILFINVTRERKKALLSIYPSIKFFIDKTIENTADKIIMENDLFNIDEELEEYNNRRVLNDYDIHKREMTQATKDKISKALKGRGKGIPLLEETKVKIGLIHKGKIVSQETREKVSKANTGKKRSAKVKRKMSLARIGMKYKKRAKVESN